MKKILISLLVTGSLATAGSLFQVGAGYAKGDNDGDIGTAFIESNLLLNIGLRFEYSKNISEHPEFSKEDISRYGLFVTYPLPLSNTISLTPKAGLTKTDGDFTLKDTVETVSDSSTEFTYGLELNYHYNNFVALYLGYTDYGKELEIKNIDTSKMDRANYTVGVKLDF
jgi:hypothetical protein